MFRSRATTFFIHAAGWLMFLAFPILFMNRTQESSSGANFIAFSPYYWLFCVTYMGMFYLNALVLVPRLVFRKKYVYYGIIVLVLLSCVYYLQPYDNLLLHNLKQRTKPKTAPTEVMNTMPGQASVNSDTLPQGPTNLPFGPLPHQDLRMQDPRFKQANHVIFIHQSGNIDMVGLFIFILVMGLSVAISTVQKWQVTEQKIIKTEAEKANAELSFLKAQINPHFLFNTLNNIYTLSVTGSEHTSDSIMKLSNIMRYVTDEVTSNYVLLKSEIDCIDDYIDLQKLRLGSKTTLEFNVAGMALNQRITPLILMTFIENVFKYGISKHEASTIRIALNIEGQKLSFFCQNQIFEYQSSLKSTGIGITNTRKRLEHLYHDKHTLDITNADGVFTIRLEMDLD